MGVVAIALAAAYVFSTPLSDRFRRFMWYWMAFIAVSRVMSAGIY